MTAYEIMKARHELEEKKRELRTKLQINDEAMRSARENYYAAEADVDKFSEDEIDELCGIYEERCATVDHLEELIDILDDAIEVFRSMETAVDDLIRAKIWEG
jgi:hypothetical protein